MRFGNENPEQEALPALTLAGVLLTATLTDTQVSSRQRM
jgi:hypothetical protein